MQNGKWTESRLADFPASHSKPVLPGQMATQLPSHQDTVDCLRPLRKRPTAARAVEESGSHCLQWTAAKSTETEAAQDRQAFAGLILEKFAAGKLEQQTSDQMQATSRVWQLPPIESFRKCVSLDERYGTCFAFFLDSAIMTCTACGGSTSFL